MKEQPLVSVIIPAYNAEKYIKEAIESVLNQTYKNIELIVVDDGSTDNTAEIVKKYLNDPRVKYIYQENKGLAGARNTGIKKAKGDYIAFLDADDFYLPEKIEKEVKFLKEHPEFDIVYCNMEHFYDGKSKILFQHRGPFYSGNVFEKLLNKFFGQADTLLIPKKILDKIGLFDEKMRYSEDWDLLLRISWAGFKFGFIKEPLLRIRIHKGSHSDMNNQWKMKKDALYLFDKLFKKMSPAERKQYNSEKIIKKIKLKLAISYLIIGRKKDFHKTILSASSNFFEKLIFYFFIGFIFLIPNFILKFLTQKIWQFKQKKLFSRVN